MLWNTAFLGNNRLAAIAIKTSGPDSKIHEIIQICVFPLSSRFKLAKDITPFYSDIRPVKSIDNFDFRFMRTDRYKELLDNANSPQVVAELFDEWMKKKINLMEGKKLLPLVYNWGASKQFIKNWLGQYNFDYYFSDKYRDILSAALFCNDLSEAKINDIPYLKTTLTTLAKTLHVEYARHDETILQCKSISEVYVALLRNF